MRARLEKQEETKKFINDFIKEREAWKQKERSRIDEENRRIAEYAALQAERLATQQSKKQAVIAERNAIYEKASARVKLLFANPFLVVC